VLQERRYDNLKSETLHFPNVNSLMKISLGLILFTMLSTVLVYAETSSDIISVQINENAYIQTSGNFVDNSSFSSSPGTLITIVNNDDVSHTFVSGVSNSNNAGLVANYDDYLICELNEKIAPTSNTYSDDNICDFNKDDRVITDIISPGNSVSFLLSDVGTYRMIDTDYPWIEFAIYVFPDSNSSNNINSGFPQDDRIPVQIPESETELAITPFVETLLVTVDGMPFDVSYTTTGLSVYEIESDTDSMSLIFYVNVDDSNGKLNVTFEREFFDSTYDGEDDLFFVLIDGDETISKETKTTSQSRSLTIDVPLGTEELEIIGSVFGISKELPSVTETTATETTATETTATETTATETTATETTATETTATETPSTNECGPGTVLKNDVCVLDQRCGPGTVLKNDVCVLDSASTNSSSSGNSRELIMGVTVAFAIAGVIGIIFAIISKFNKNKH
jgi:hypothetical protein